jgi:hypothetical protein
MSSEPGWQNRHHAVGAKAASDPAARQASAMLRQLQVQTLVPTQAQSHAHVRKHTQKLVQGRPLLRAPG